MTCARTRLISLVGFCLVIVLFSRGLRAADLPITYAIDKIAEFSPDTWGDAQKDGETAFRSAKSGKCYFRVPNWWGGSDRPPEGKRYVIEIAYKDTVSAPVRVLAFGALSRYSSPHEVHRIGGLKDDKWKVGHVPLSWDMVILPQGKKHAEIHLRVPKEQEFPVSKITIRKAKLPEDQVRYEAECRDWVRRVQAEKAKQAPARKPETPVIPEAWKDKPIVPFARNYNLDLHRASAPKKGEAGAPVHIRMARNEFEPGVFGVYAQQDLKGVTYTVSEMKGEAGALACEIRTCTFEYALVRGKKDKPFYWNSQRIWPAYAVDIPKGGAHGFWIILKSLGEKTKPGKYAGTITIKAGEQTASLPLKVEVLPIKLLTMDEAGLSMGGCVTGYTSETEMRTMLEYNHNIINIWWAGVKPQMKKDGDGIALDFHYMDDFMERARKCGIRSMVWFLGGNPNGYPGTISIERDIYQTLHPDEPRDAYHKKQHTPEQRGKIQPEIEKAYKKLIKDIVAHANEKKWPELIFTPFDEPAKWAYRRPKAQKGYAYAIGCGPWTRDHFKAGCKLLHEAAPKNKVYVSMHRNFHRKVHGYSGRVGEIFIPDVDLVCTNAIDEDHNLNKKTWDAGKLFWQYSGRHGGRFTFGWWFARWGSTGSLCWAYNWSSRLDISSSYNWVYAWSSPFETIATPTYELLREGWDDRRYWATAVKLAKEKKVDIEPLLKPLREEIMKNRGSGGRDLVLDFWEEAQDATMMDQWRKRLADKIVELSK